MHLKDIIQMEKHNHFILVVPSDKRNDSPISKNRKAAFMKRLVRKVLESDPNLDQKTILSHLDESNGIDHNGRRYLKLPCFIKNYP